MKKNRLRTRFIALAMAIISTISVGSMFTASAAEAPNNAPTVAVTEESNNTPTVAATEESNNAPTVAVTEANTLNTDNKTNTNNLTTTSTTRKTLRNYLYNGIDHSQVNLTKHFENLQEIRLYNHENGTLIVGRPKENTLDKSNQDFSAINHIKAVTYPGSLIKINQQFLNGTPTKINADRNKMKFSVDCGRRSCTFETIPQTEGDVLEEIYKIIDNYSEHDVPAQVKTTFARASSEEQLQAELGISADVLKSLGINFKAINQCKQDTYVMKYRQIYYTVSAELPQHADEVFADTVTKTVLVNNKVNSENLPAYVSSVSYGREVYVVISSDLSKTSIEASEKLAAQKFSFTAKEEWQKTLENCSVNVFMLGGASSNITEMLKVKDFDSFIETIGKETEFTPANCSYPLSYTANYITTNERVATKVTGDYTEFEYTTRTSTPLEVNFKDLCPAMKSAKITITGKYISGVDENGNFTHDGDYTKVYESTLRQLNKKTNIPANVDLKTVKIKFEYTGTAARRFGKEVYSLGDYNGNIDNIKVEIEGWMRLLNILGYSVEAKVWINETSNFSNSNTDFYTTDNGPRL